MEKNQVLQFVFFSVFILFMISFISFEGGDGSGKTTQLNWLGDYLAGKGRICARTREPGGTKLGETIRQLLLEIGGEDMPAQTELFLYLADRSHHVHKMIRPALRSGQLVLCDRFTDSTLAYQGFGRGIDFGLLQRLNQFASAGINPDLTFLLDCPVELGLSRILRRADSREDRFEREKLEFHERVRNGFLELARQEPNRICVIDASRTANEVREGIRKIIDEKLKDSLR